MATDRFLINYLPQFMQEYLEMQEIMKVEQIDVDDLWTAFDNVFSDQFVMDATENGVSRYEKMLGISPKGTDTLDERKFRILAMMNQELPYTYRRLEQVLTNLCGEDGFSIVLNHNEYHVEIKLALGNKNNYSEVVDVLRKMIPANMTQHVQIMYNTHDVLSQYTHGRLSAYTHDQLRNEVLTNG